MRVMMPSIVRFVVSDRMGDRHKTKFLVDVTPPTPSHPSTALCHILQLGIPPKPIAKELVRLNNSNNRCTVSAGYPSSAATLLNYLTTIHLHTYRVTYMMGTKDARIFNTGAFLTNALIPSFYETAGTCVADYLDSRYTTFAVMLTRVGTTGRLRSLRFWSWSKIFKWMMRWR